MRTLNTMVKHLKLALKSQRFMSTKTSEGEKKEQSRRWAGQKKSEMGRKQVNSFRRPSLEMLGGLSSTVAWPRDR